jgi:hypothetical protein
LALQAAISDASAVAQALRWYRTDSRGPFVSVPLQAAGPEQFQATISLPGGDTRRLE